MTVPKIGVLKHGENTTITCNLTRNPVQGTVLKRISWYKDGILLESIRNPDPDTPFDFLGPLVLNNNGIRSRDGGNYTCFLEVALRNIRMYNVSDSTMVESKCTVDPDGGLVLDCDYSQFPSFSPASWTFHRRDVRPSMTEIPY